MEGRDGQIFIDHLAQTGQSTGECNIPAPASLHSRSWSSKCRHINKEYFIFLTRELFKTFHAKQCPKCSCKDFSHIANRPTEVYCTSCRTHYSLTSNTPLDKYRLPLWTFGYLVQKSLDLHPQPLTIMCIKTKLSIGTKIATLLKRRLKLFKSDLMPAVQKMKAISSNGVSLCIVSV